jgi:hypothetical protein
MNILRSFAVAAGLLAAASACSAEPDERAELTRAQKDSIVAELPIPGASGVGGAMEARDRANARASAHDELLGNTP